MAEYFREVVWQGRRIPVLCARKNVRGLRLRVLSGGRVRLSLPYWADEPTASKFLASKAEWIAKACDSIRMTADDGRVSKGPDGMPSKVRVRGCWASVSADAGSEGVRAGCAGVVVGTAHCKTAAGAEARLKEWLAAEARADFDRLCDGFGPIIARMGCARPVISVRDMRSLWGSCRPQKCSITMNLRLIHESPAFTEYVMLHEIAHLRHPGHGAGFAAFMDKSMPDWRERRKLARMHDQGAEKAADNM